ncbi:MAG: MgtC/SapB family protein [Candidatus Binatia bacterium]
MDSLLDFISGDVAKLLLALLLGGLIGIERELTGKPAGLRTNVLIALGAALVTIISVKVAGERADPGRIAAQIVTGVGFIGAGSIIQARGAVTGLTTAATIWAVAGIGMAVGIGEYVLASATTAIILCSLVILGRLNPNRIGERGLVHYALTLGEDADVKSVLALFIDAKGVEIESTSVDTSAARVHVTVSCIVGKRDRDELLDRLSSCNNVHRIEQNC